MKKVIFALAAILAVFMFMACTTTVARPVDASNNPIGSKVGEQSESVTVILNMFPFNYSIDASASKAAQNGGITRIATVDIRTEVVNKVFIKDITYTTIVTGE
jgi:hypothetical protein